MLCFRPNVLYKARDHGCAGCTAGGGDLYGYDITTLHKPRRLLWGIMNKCSVHFICRLSALPLFTVFTEHLNLLYNKKKNMNLSLYTVWDLENKKCMDSFQFILCFPVASSFICFSQVSWFIFFSSFLCFFELFFSHHFLILLAPHCTFPSFLLYITA